MYMTAIVFADLDIAPCVHRQFLLKKKEVWKSISFIVSGCVVLIEMSYLLRLF